jgi:beta-1,4-N-acetylglucosaminyltransferase
MPRSQPCEDKAKRVCFVTCGATAQFPELVQAVLSPDAIQAFVAHGFTHLNIQCGESYASVKDLNSVDTMGLHISMFDFNQDGLNKYMRACQGEEVNGQQGYKKGLLICHAGMY